MRRSRVIQYAPQVTALLQEEGVRLRAYSELRTHSERRLTLREEEGLMPLQQTLSYYDQEGEAVEKVLRRDFSPAPFERHAAVGCWRF